MTEQSLSKRLENKPRGSEPKQPGRAAIELVEDQLEGVTGGFGEGGGAGKVPPGPPYNPKF
jgi:hypothetical protein